MKPLVTVAIPVLNGNRYLPQVLAAVRSQELPGKIELLVADSGSSDGSLATAERYGARVLTVPPGEFSHGGTRNLLAGQAQGKYIAFLTQDAIPARSSWLVQLIEAFQLDDRIALTYGPYSPREDASVSVASELVSFFSQMSPNGQPIVHRKELTADLRSHKLWSDVGSFATFFTDANGCVLRSAWKQVPFRQVTYAEDRVLAIDMLQAGYAKAFVPTAAVIHSHEYSTANLLRRSFDEYRALREIYGYIEPGGLRHMMNSLRGKLRRDMDFLHAQNISGPVLFKQMMKAGTYHATKSIGATLGSRADMLSPSWRTRLSLDRRPSFEPLHGLFDEPEAV